MCLELLMTVMPESLTRIPGWSGDCSQPELGLRPSAARSPPALPRAGVSAAGIAASSQLLDQLGAELQRLQHGLSIVGVLVGAPWYAAGTVQLFSSRKLGLSGRRRGPSWVCL